MLNSFVIDGSGPTKFGSKKELRSALNSGDIISGKKSLELIEMVRVDVLHNPVGNVLNMELLHEHAFVLNPKTKLMNSGFFDLDEGDIVREDRHFPGNTGSYQFGSINVSSNQS